MQFLGQAPESPRSIKVRGQSLPRLVVRPGASLSPGAEVSSEVAQKFASQFLFDAAGVTYCVTSMFSLASRLKKKYPTAVTLPQNEKTYLRNMADGLFNTVNNAYFPISQDQTGGPFSPFLQAQSLDTGVSADFIGRISAYLLLVLDGDVMQFSDVELEGLSSRAAANQADINGGTKLFLKLVVELLAGFRKPEYTISKLITTFDRISATPITSSSSNTTGLTVYNAATNTTGLKLSENTSILPNIAPLFDQQLNLSTFNPTGITLQQRSAYALPETPPPSAPLRVFNGLGQSSTPPTVQSNDDAVREFLAKFIPLATKVAILLRIIEIGGQEILVPTPVHTPYIPRWACKVLGGSVTAETLAADPNDLIPREHCKDIMPEKQCPMCEITKCPECPLCEITKCPKCADCPACVFDSTKCPSCEKCPSCAKCPACPVVPAAATDATPKVKLDDKVMKPWVWAVVIGGVGAVGYLAWKKGLLKF